MLIPDIQQYSSRLQSNSRMYLTLMVLGLLVSCTVKQEQAPSAKPEANPEVYFLDTIQTLDPLTRERVRLQLWKESGVYGIENNGLLTYLHHDSVRWQDSVSITPPYHDLLSQVDFDQDGTKDLLIFCSSDVRSNLQYYLYLSRGHELHQVQGFEEIKNPEYDSIHCLIHGFAISGRNYEEDYTLDSNLHLKLVATRDAK